MYETTAISERYELGEFIGSGAMGDVYRGRDLRTGDAVAIKMLRPELIHDHPELVERFRREGEALHKLNHPNIVKVLAAVEDQNQYYLVMEYVGGGTLAALLKHQPQLPLDHALAIALELADALSRTHHLNIVHRDIKPANILLAEDGTPRLTDFGLAFTPSGKRLTQPGITLGTWLYLSPEVCTGATPDVRSDVWAFGSVLYEMLAGRPPFSGSSPAAVLQAIISQPLLSVTEFRDDIPPPLDDLVRRMLAKESTQRVASFRQIGAELEALVDGKRVSLWNAVAAQAEPPPADSAEIEVQWMEESFAAAPMSTPRLLTKLTIPPPRPQSIPRERLLQLLENGLRHGRLLTLVSAPPGFGKTSLVTAWLASRPRPTAWLSLDASDNDPIQFFQYLLATLQQIEPHVGRTTAQLLQSPQSLNMNSLLAPLLNDLASVAPCILVLDDYHTITTTHIHEAVRFLLDHLPQALHLVIITREDPPLPLARLRVRDQLSEIRERDLRFTHEETAAFLNDTMQLALAEEDVKELGLRTEGWIAGLQLAAVALKENQDDARAFISDFTGDNRYVMDYLISEVIERQSAAVRDFLRQTSILDKLTAPLCEAVTGRTDSQTILEQLEHANLFMVPLDRKRVWYRYHQLFADVLRLTLTPDERVVLHERAAHWFESQGRGGEAIHHAFAAAAMSGAYSEVVRLLRVYLEIYLNDGRQVTILTWLDTLPDSVVFADPELAIYKAWALTLIGDMARATDCSTFADAVLSSGNYAESSRGKLRLVQSMLALTRGDFVQTTQYAQEALALFQVEHPHWRITAYWVLAEAQERSAPITDAILSLQEASTMGRASGKLVMSTVLETSLASALDVHGQRGAALAVCHAALARNTDEQGRAMPIAAVIFNRLAVLHYEANDLAQTDSFRQQGLTLAQQFAPDMLLAVSDGLTAMVLAARGELDAALSNTRAGLQRVGPEGLADVTWIAAIEGSIHLRRGDMASAQRWAEAAGLTPNDQPHYLHMEQHIVYARLLLAQGRLADAQHWLGRLSQFAEERGYRRWLASVRILQALAAERSNDPNGVRLHLTEAVRIAAPEGYYRLFLDEIPAVMALLPRVRAAAPAFVDALLDSARGVMVPEVPSQTDQITERELEVLRLLSHGLSNAEIAERLVLSTGTVKQHINHIYGKLDVHSRTQAVAQARTLGLLAER